SVLHQLCGQRPPNIHTLAAGPGSAGFSYSARRSFPLPTFTSGQLMFAPARSLTYARDIRTYPRLSGPIRTYPRHRFFFRAAIASRLHSAGLRPFPLGREGEPSATLGLDWQPRPCTSRTFGRPLPWGEGRSEGKLTLQTTRKLNL